MSASFSFFISLLLSTYSMNNLISLKAPISSWLKIVLLGIATTGIIYLLKYLILSNGLLELAIILVVSGAFYISGCFLLKIVEIDELKHLLKVAK